MKSMKKIAGVLLAICLMIPCFSLLTYAANGRIEFTDPSTKVGETLQLKGALKADAAIEDRTIVMKYDTTMLKFKSGDNVKENSSGQLTYELNGTKSGTTVEFFMNFDVLKEGTTKVEVVSYKAWTTGSAQIQCSGAAIGSSTITIAAGEVATQPTEEPGTPTVPVNITINNNIYTLSNSFDKIKVPEGFTEGVLEYNGSEHKVLENTTSGVRLACMLDAAGEASLFLYVPENATFVPYRGIKISDSVTITILSNRDDVTISDAYVETVAIIDDVEFPAWQNPEQTELCILYAVNNEGEKNLYQFDTVEGTYQRFVETKIAEVEDVNPQEGILGMIIDNLKLVLLVAAAVAVFVVILIIVLSVKLYNRNAELDELYDEYGIDLDDEDDEHESDEEEFFIRIDEEPEDDVILEPGESIDEVPEIKESIFVAEPKSDEPEVDELVKRTEVAEAPSLKDDIDEISKRLSEGQGKAVLPEDEEEDDFEMDFIDLDD